MKEYVEKIEMVCKLARKDCELHDTHWLPLNAATEVKVRRLCRTFEVNEDRVRKLLFGKEQVQRQQLQLKLI